MAFNYGFNAVRFSVQYASLRDVHTTKWWLDVETVNSWTVDASANISALQGMIAGLKHYTFLPNIGFYAYPGQWDLLTNDWQNGYTAWAATGTTDRTSALAACSSTSFTGGVIQLTQYTAGLDKDYLCPDNQAETIP